MLRPYIRTAYYPPIRRSARQNEYRSVSCTW